MKLTSFSIRNFRNLEAVDLKKIRQTVIVVGPNASGKSNFIEALRYLTLTRSYKNVTDKQLMTAGCRQSFLTARFKKKNTKFRLSYTFDKNKPSRFKEIYWGQDRQGASEVLGKVLTIHFSVEDLNYFLDSPRLRRKYFNILFCLYSQSYWTALSTYQKIIKHRNLVLKQIWQNKIDTSELEFWDQELAGRGASLIYCRYKFCRRLNKLLQKDSLGLVEMFKKKVMIKYQPSVKFEPKQANLEQIKANFINQLQTNRESEIKLKQTLIGPQRDRLELVMAGQSLKKFASRGEIRSAVLALKVAELDWLKKKFKSNPILLLDDIFSELDDQTKLILKQVIGKQQTFITTTNLNNLDNSLRVKAQIFSINQGKIKLMKIV